jgi:hypothetical protein
MMNLTGVWGEDLVTTVAGFDRAFRGRFPTLGRFPNVHVEIGARIGEPGRQPRTARRFFDLYQDRILFGTDAVPLGFEPQQQVFGGEPYRISCRFVETEPEYFDYAPARIPPQARCLACPLVGP